MAKPDLIEKFNACVSECIQTPVTELVSNPNWGSINFQDAFSELDRTFVILKHFQVLPVELLPDASVQNIILPLERLKTIIGQIRKFTIEQSDPSAACKNLVNQVRQHADDFYNTAHLFIPYLAYQKGEVQRNIEQLTRHVHDAELTAKEAHESIRNKAEEIDKIIVATREAAASVGVAHFTSDFTAEVSRREKQARNWLVTTGFFAVATLAAAIIFLFIAPPGDATPAFLAQYFTSKLVILGVLFTGTIWCGRLFKASKHLASVNAHRANALKTFQAFTKAASDDASRDAVLMETTKSIFALTPSGFLDVGDGSQDSGMKIVEVVRSIAQTNKS